MHAADAARREDADAGEMGGDHGGGDRGGAGAAGREREGEVGARHLHHVLEAGEALQLVRRQADPDLAVHDGDGRRHRAIGPHDVLDGARRRDVVGIGHAMRDDRRFQSDQRLAVGLRRRDFVGQDDEIGLRHSENHRSEGAGGAEFGEAHPRKGGTWPIAPALGKPWIAHQP